MVKTAILESHPYRHPPALQRILRYAALELGSPRSANPFRDASCIGHGWLALWDAPVLSLSNEPDGLVDNKGDRGGSGKT